MPKFLTVRFGELAYREEDVIHLPAGLVGMPDLRRWLVLETGDELPLKWVQSLDRGDFGFPVSQPAFFTDSYDIPLSPDTWGALKGREGDWLAVMVITTVHHGGSRITGNLLAPLVVNVETRTGLQLVLDDPDLSIQQEINYLKFGLAVDGQSAENESVTDSGQSQVSSEVETPELAEV